MDLFVVPTISFQLLYGLLILRHDRRQILWLGVIAHPTTEWISRQLTEAHGFHQCHALQGVSVRRLWLSAWQFGGVEFTEQEAEAIAS